VLTATIWCSGGLVPDLAFVTSSRVSMVKSNQAFVGGSWRIQTRCGRVLSPCRIVGGGGIQVPWSGLPNSIRLLRSHLRDPPVLAGQAHARTTILYPTSEPRYRSLH
jgi:hypothetical protein